MSACVIVNPIRIRIQGMAGQKVPLFFTRMIDFLSIAGQDWKKWCRLIGSLLSMTLLSYFLVLGCQYFLSSLLFAGNTLPAFYSSSLLLAYLIPLLSTVLVASLLCGVVLFLGGSFAWIQRAFFLLPHKKQLRVKQFWQVFWVMLPFVVTAVACSLSLFSPYVVLLSVLVGVMMIPFLLTRALYLESVGRLLPFKLMQYHGFNSLASYVVVCGFVGAVPVLVLSGARLSLFLHAFSLGAIKAEVFYFTKGLETGTVFGTMVDFSTLVYVVQYIFATPNWYYYLVGMPSSLVLVSVVMSIFLSVSQGLLLQCASFCVCDGVEGCDKYANNQQRYTKSFLSEVNLLERPAVLFSLAGLCSFLSCYLSVPVFLVAVFNMFNAYAKIPLTFKEDAVMPMSLQSFFLDGDLGGKDNGLTKGVDPNQFTEGPCNHKLV